MIFYVIIIVTPAAFEHTARNSWNLTRAEKEILQQKESWIETLCNELKLSLQLLITPMKRLEKIPIEDGLQSMQIILQQTIIINAVVDNLLLVADTKDNLESKYLSEDIVEVQRVYFSITRSIQIMLKKATSENAYIDQFIDSRFPQVVRINEVFFTALVKNMILAALEYLQVIVLNDGKVKKIISFEVSGTDALMICSISFNINPQGAPPKFSSESIYVETLNTICKVINGTCDVKNESLTVTVPCKFTGELDNSKKQESYNDSSKGSLEVRTIANKRSALVLYDNASLVEALISALENLLILQVINFNQVNDLNKIFNLVRSYDVVFVTSGIRETLLKTFNGKNLFILYTGKSTNPNQGHDYVLHLPCLSTDTIDLLSFISKYFFFAQQHYHAKYTENKEYELGDIENDFGGTVNINVKSKVKYSLHRILSSLMACWDLYIIKGFKRSSMEIVEESGYNYKPKSSLFMNVFDDDVEAEYVEWRYC